MRILILGGAGFLGNNLIRRYLREPDNKITVLDSLEPRLKSDEKHLREIKNSIEFIKGDIRDKQLMEEVVKGKEVVFNCAGQTSHSLSFSDPIFDMEINCGGSLNLLEAVRLNSPQALVIYTSSSTVIGRAVSEVVSENHSEYPLDIYSANKAAAEKYYYLYHKVYDLNTLVLRFANLYGPYGKGYPEFGFINYFIAQAFAGKEITIYGDGSQTRNVMYVEDAVDLLYQCALKKKFSGNIYFAVHREHYSVRQIAETIVSVFGTGKVIKVDWPAIRRRIEIDNVIISGERLFYEMQWKPRYSLIEGLERTKKIIGKDSRGVKQRNT